MASILVAAFLAALGLTDAAPMAKPEDNGFQFPITFSNGKIGVNFLGFHASAGLGGLLTGNPADGGLQAEAGTPFGQKAWAGLGGQSGNGRSSGGLYAGATAGGGIGAKAGLGGTAGEDGNFGTSYAGASAGGLQASKVRTTGGLRNPNVGIPKEYYESGDFYAAGGFGGYAQPEPYYPPYNSYKNFGAKVVEREQPAYPPLVIEFSDDNLSADNSNIQVIKKESKVKKTAKVSPPLNVPVEEDIKPPSYDLDVREKAGVVPPPPPPPLPVQYPVYVEKTKYKLRRRPHHHRKYVVVTNGIVPPPEVPVIPPGDGFIEGPPGNVVVTRKIVPIGIAPNPVPISLDQAERLVGGFSHNFDGPPIGKKQTKDNININKSLELNIEINKKLGTNVEASKSADDSKTT